MFKVNQHRCDSDLFPKYDAKKKIKRKQNKAVGSRSGSSGKINSEEKMHPNIIFDKKNEKKNSTDF